MTIIAPVQRAELGDHFHAFSLRGVSELIDPFLGVDHAWMSTPTFPPHPHSGFSAISYVFTDSETGIRNWDSIGTTNLIRPGGLHWTTAGRGIVHEEKPAEEGKTVHSLQIFVNLSEERRNTAPFILGLEPEEVPIVRLDGSEVRLLAGQFATATSPLNPPTDVTMLDVALEQGAELLLPVEVQSNSFMMPISGRIEVDGKCFDRDDLQIPVFESRPPARAIRLRAPEHKVRAMLFSGRRLHRS